MIKIRRNWDKQLNMKTYIKYSVPILFLTGILLARAQTSEPQMNLTWQTRTYAPASYPGKHLPSGNSRVFLALDVVQNGKVADLSGQDIYWYRKDELFASGRGLVRTEFTTPGIALGSLDIRAEVLGLSLIKTISLPMTVPVAVIEAPFPGGQFKEKSITITAQPFFFNVPNMSWLTYEWSVNGKSPDSSEMPQALVINVNPGTADGYKMNISLKIVNPVADLESASQNAALTYRQ